MWAIGPDNIVSILGSKPRDIIHTTCLLPSLTVRAGIMTGDLFCPPWAFPDERTINVIHASCFGVISTRPWCIRSLGAGDNFHVAFPEDFLRLGNCSEPWFLAYLRENHSS